jgi:hypothetical protein
VSGAWLEIQVMVFCIMTPFCDVVGYHHFGGLFWCLRLQSEVQNFKHFSSGVDKIVKMNSIM